MLNAREYLPSAVPSCLVREIEQHANKGWMFVFRNQLIGHPSLWEE
jgi:hypothetical protein